VDRTGATIIHLRHIQVVTASWFRRNTSRRRFLAGADAIPAALALGSRPTLARSAAPALAQLVPPRFAADLYAFRNFAWVW
jgi:hypothetical protein